MCVTTLACPRIERQFAQTIIDQNRNPVSDSEFSNANRLRSEINGDQAGWRGHRVKGLNRNSKMPNQISMMTCSNTSFDIINTGLQAGAASWCVNPPLSTASPKSQFPGKPLKRLEKAWRPQSIGLK